MHRIIQEKAMELALKHQAIIEDEAKRVCKEFNCKAEDLDVHFLLNDEIKMFVKVENNLILGAHFKITNYFCFESKEQSMTCK